MLFSFILLSFGIIIRSTYRCNALNYNCIIKLSTSSERLSNYRSSNSDILQNARLIDLDSLLSIDYSGILSTIPCPQSARFTGRRRKWREQLNGKASGSQTESERIIRRGTEKTGIQQHLLNFIFSDRAESWTMDKLFAMKRGFEMSNVRPPHNLSIDRRQSNVQHFAKRVR